ncbi:hypothetical protein EJB05_40827, partial [Eragrostis curvula]
MPDAATETLAPPPSTLDAAAGRLPSLPHLCSRRSAPTNGAGDAATTAIDRDRHSKMFIVTYKSSSFLIAMEYLFSGRHDAYRKAQPHRDSPAGPRTRGRASSSSSRHAVARVSSAAASPRHAPPRCTPRSSPSAPRRCAEPRSPRSASEPPAKPARRNPHRLAALDPPCTAASERCEHLAAARQRSCSLPALDDLQLHATLRVPMPQARANPHARPRARPRHHCRSPTSPANREPI